MKRNTFLVEILLFCSFVLIISCDTSKDCPPCFTPPETLNLMLTDKATGEDLIFNHTYSPDTIMFYCYLNGFKVALEQGIYLDSSTSRVIIYTSDPSWKSPTGIKDFYLYLGNNDTDTIFLDVEEKHNECCTYYDWKEFKINGNTMEIDTNLHVYVLKK